MARIIDSRQTERFFVYVFRNSAEFDRVVEPSEAQETASSVASGAVVRMGSSPNASPELQSVKVPRRFGEAKARDLARKIASKLEG